MRVKIERINPKKARQYLERNKESNRNLRESVVLHYAKQMIDGNYVPTSDGVGFDINGDLVNGQHRLNAVIRADKTVEMIVVYDLPLESFQVTDHGCGRTTADTLSTLGYPHGSALAALCRHLAIISTSSDYSLGTHPVKRHGYCDQHAINLIEMKPEIVETVGRLCGAVKKGAGICTPAQLSVWWFLTHYFMRTKFDAEEFWTQFAENDKLQKGSGRHALYVRLQKDKVADKAKMQAGYKLYAGLIAVRKEKAGDGLRTIRFPDRPHWLLPRQARKVLEWMQLDGHPLLKGGDR